MRKTTEPLEIKHWYIGMEYMANKFGIIKGPYSKKKMALHVKSTTHECILLKKDGQWFLTHRKNSGKWKQVESQKIQMASPS